MDAIPPDASRRTSLAQQLEYYIYMENDDKGAGAEVIALQYAVYRSLLIAGQKKRRGSTEPRRVTD